MRNLKKSVALLLCALLVMTLLFSSVCIVRAANHVCTGECCLICVLLARVERVLHGLMALLPAMAALFALRLLGQLCLPQSAVRRAAHGTLVGWKIRLDD
ncbi:MAG: hypothetical protein IJ664_04775 [Clostridia bacterium]|nr:hypothetical protein [Clostridia bacterium]